MGRKKINRVTVAFICSPKVCEILTSSETENYNRSSYVNAALKAAIEQGHKSGENYNMPPLSPRVSVSMDREINMWLDEHTKLTSGKSNYINSAIERYACK